MKDGGPAFPVQTDQTSMGPITGYPGMTLRDYFAGQALVGCLARGSFDGLGASVAAALVYGLADAMLKEREKEE